MPQPPAECGINYKLGGESWLDEKDRTPHRWSWEAWHGPLFDNKPDGHLAGTHSVKMDYVPGERRCLLTTWAVHSGFDIWKPTALHRAFIEKHPIRETFEFWHAGLGTPKPEWAGKSRPGRFLPNHLRPLMPVFEIVSVKAERVQEISPDDCRAEGMPVENNDVGVRYGFGQLWNSINESRGYGWQVNPWVWGVTFNEVTP